MFPYVSYVLPCLGDSLASLVIILCHTAIRCYPIDLVLVAALSVPSQGPMSLPKNALSPPERCHRGWEPWEPMGAMDMAGPTPAPSRREATACLKGCDEGQSVGG